MRLYVGVFVTAVVAYAAMFWGSETSARRRYGVCIDAGSSGTRVYVFTWQQRDGEQVLLHTLQQVDWKRWKPGLSALATTDRLEAGAGVLEAAAADAVQPMIERAVAAVPAAARGETPVMLMATAGLRLLPEAVSGRILDGVRTALHASPFGFGDEWAKVLSGQLEAVYMWTSTQVLLGTLGAGADVSTADLGGASTQITVPYTPSHAGDGTADADAAAVDVVADVSIQQMDGSALQRRLLAVSFLGLGQNEAFASFVRWFGATHGPDAVCPCLLVGQEEEAGNVRGPAAANTVDFRDCQRAVKQWFQHVVGPDGADVEPLMAAARAVLGRPGVGIVDLFAFDNYPKDVLSLFAMQPAGWEPFADPSSSLAADGTMEVAGDALLALPDHARQASRVRLTRTHIDSRAAVVCPNVALDDATEQLAFRNQPARNRKFCWGAAYISHLLGVYGVSPEQPVTLAQDVGGVEANWPLGAMCHRLGVIEVK